APVREIAQVGAVLGREFSYELIHAVFPVDEGMLQQGLRQLVEAELVYQRGLPPQATYLFKHALVQDTAYQSLLKSKRQQLHQEIAQVLTNRFPDTSKTQPELLAYHYTEAGLKQQAIPYWQQAGQSALSRSANIEAISHLTKGLELLKTLSDTHERARQELDLQTTLGLAFMSTKGYAAPEVGKAYARARELSRQVGETPQLASVLQGLWIFHLVRGELQTAHEVAQQFMRLARSTEDPTLLMEAHHALGDILYFLGEFSTACAHAEQSIALYHPQQHSPQVRNIAQDPGVMSRCYAALSLWYLGCPEQALKKCNEALTLAKELSHPFSVVFVLNTFTGVHVCRRDWQAVQEWAETEIAFATEHGFGPFAIIGTMHRGRALAEQGHGEEGIAQMHQGLAAYRATGTELGRSLILAGLAEVNGKAGQIEEGLSAVAEALAIVNRTEGRRDEAELYRLKGQLMLQQSGVRSPASEVPNTQHPTPSPQAEAEAEACFLKAIEIAHRQSAKSLELRAATSLARLWRQQGKALEAHHLLSEIYSWFTEGFDTTDLQDAKALLEELE
ncbi:MAG: hypothetical protein HY268_14380, partial [Deltaproteobacteria bacterium]|nr:hypothetical protein [Deltaproteobacteria bacterium]